MQNMTFGPNEAAGIEKDSNVLISGENFIATFGIYTEQAYILELASYGTYRDEWKFPNMSCVSEPCGS